MARLIHPCSFHIQEQSPVKLSWGGNEGRAPTCLPRDRVEELLKHSGAPSCQQLQSLLGNVKAQAG